MTSNTGKDLRLKLPESYTRLKAVKAQNVANVYFLGKKGKMKKIENKVDFLANFLPMTSSFECRTNDVRGRRVEKKFLFLKAMVLTVKKKDNVIAISLLCHFIEDPSVTERSKIRRRKGYTI